MAEERKDLPAATSDNFAARARETLMTYLGRQGDPLDRGITLRDLVEGGLVAVREGFSLGGRGKLPIQPAPALGGGATAEEEKDLTPPPTPTGLVVSAGISNLLIEHDAPLYSQGHGHGRTLVFGAKAGSGSPPVFANAVKIHEFTGTVSAYPTDPATTWHIWIKWVSVDGVESSAPGGGTNGVVATTGQDPAKVLQMLTGQITETQLYADLGERIDLIDGNGTGSVNARIQTEKTSLTSAITAEAQARETLAVAVGENTVALQAESTARANADGTLFAQYTVKIDNNGYVSGFGLASSANNAAPESTFAVRADTFYIASPTGPGVTPALPFIVKTTAGAWGPAGVYIQEALIANATIGSAKIADAAIDDAKVANLSAAKLTAGDGTIGGLLKSSNYVVGSAGWMIHPNGTAEFAAAAIRGQLVASQIDSRGLSIKDGSGNVILAAGTPLTASNITPSASWLNGNITLGANGALSGGGGGQVTLPGMGVNTFRILTRGNSSTQHPAGALGIYRNGSLLADVARSYVIGKISRTTGDYTPVGAYDVLVGQGDTAAAALNAIGSDFIVVVYSYDEPQGGRTTAFLNAMYRHGASRAILGSPNFRYRSAYALIGIGACGEGNGAEIYQGAIDYDPAAWIDVGFSVVNGVLTGVSSATTPKSLSDYGYVGDLNATANQPDSTVNAGIASAATTAIWTGVSGAGKPQDNATVGATIGTNLVGQFTPANSSTYIADAAIKSAHIENLAVNSAKIDDLAVTAAKIADLAVTSAKIADASINSAKIGNLAVDSIHIVGEAVTTSRFGSANGYQRYWSGYNHIYSNIQVEDTYCTIYVPVRAGEQTLITVSYVETMSGSYSYNDNGTINSYPTVISREPRIRVNGALLPVISGIHGCVRALYFSDSTQTIQIDFAVWVRGTQDGYYQANKLIMSAFTARR